MTTILGIESSCDETAAAVVRDGRSVLSNVVASQHDLHVEYGGVVPEIASRAHIERLYPVVEQALKRAGVGRGDLDAVAVGHRPGLIGSLLVGVAAAKTLAWAWKKPLIGVDHIVAHLHAPVLDDDLDIRFPAIGLVVSGGHTTLFYMRSPIEVEAIGRTIDDAVGEAYDKAAMVLRLGYPGGPALDRRAASGDDRAHDFPVAALGPDSLDFSFSGLKTALLYAVRGTPGRRAGVGEHGLPARGSGVGGGSSQESAAVLSEREINDLCASFQRAAVEALMLKAGRAFEKFGRQANPPRTLILGGGVSANSRLRGAVAEFAEQRRIALHLSKMEYCLDNAAMIAGLAALRLEAGLVDDLSLCPSPAGSV